VIIDLTPDLAQAIAFSLSERDLTEVLALQPRGQDIESEIEAWAREIFMVPDHLRTAWAASVDGDPVAMGGVVRHPYMPHLATTWAVGTDRKMDGAVQIMKAAIQAHRVGRARRDQVPVFVPRQPRAFQRMAGAPWVRDRGEIPWIRSERRNLYRVGEKSWALKQH
jgi:hypothetical protein